MNGGPEGQEPDVVRVAGLSEAEFQDLLAQLEKTIAEDKNLAEDLQVENVDPKTLLAEAQALLKEASGEIVVSFRNWQEAVKKRDEEQPSIRRRRLRDLVVSIVCYVGGGILGASFALTDSFALPAGWAFLLVIIGIGGLSLIGRLDNSKSPQPGVEALLEFE